MFCHYLIIPTLSIGMGVSRCSLNLEFRVNFSFKTPLERYQTQ